MVNPSFLKLKKYLTLDEAGQYIAHHLRKKTAGNSEILFLINEGFISCFLDCPTEPDGDDSPDTNYRLENIRYTGVAVGLQRLVNAKVGFFYDESPPYSGNSYYTSVTHDLIGDFWSDWELSPGGQSVSSEQLFKQVTHSIYSGVCETVKVRLKVDTAELVRVLEQFNPEDFTFPHDVAPLQNPSQPDSLLTKELQQAKEEIARLNAQLLEMRATNSTFVIAGALIEMLTEQKTPRRNQTKIKLELEEKGLKGLSKSSLDNLFVDANKALKASKDAG